MKFSRLAEQTEASPILAVAAAINARKQQGETIYNLTVGDFDPAIFPIPQALTEAIIRAYRARHTNYPAAAGLPQLREGAASMVNRMCGLDYQADEVIVASGCRPLVYAVYRSLVDAGDTVIYPVPSWNNENYTAMVGARAVAVETTAANHFMPTAEALAPHLKDATLVALCAPQNPTGTLFSKQNLVAICEQVIAENRRRGRQQKPLYVLFDQVYWALTFGTATFHHPAAVCPQIREVAICVDGISKAFAATGVRVGWATGPRAVLQKMSSIIGHIGAWAPKPEQIAAGAFLADRPAVGRHLAQFREQLQARLNEFHAGFMALKGNGYAVDAIAPQAAIYLSVRIAIQNRDRNRTRGAGANQLDGEHAVQEYLLNEAKIGILPFSLFGAKNHHDWFRLSVGTCSQEEIPDVMANLQAALEKLS